MTGEKKMGAENNSPKMGPPAMDYKKTYTLFHQARKLFLVIIGFTVLILGVILIFLPGPAIIVIPLGLAILAGEVVWARKFLDSVKEKIGLKK